MQVDRFDSLSECAACCEQTSAVGCAFGMDDGWAGASFHEACRLARVGDNDIAARVGQYLERFDVERLGRITKHVPDGGAVDVPGFLAGRPDCFTRRERHRNVRSPLKIVVNVTPGANFSKKQIENRGAAILALVQTAVELRPIELYALVGVDGRPPDYYMMVRLESKPLSIAHAAFALCHSAMFRQLGIRRASQFGYRGGWPNDRSEATTRARLDLSDDDLYIREMFNNDPLALNPTEWLDNAIAQIEEEDE